MLISLPFSTRQTGCFGKDEDLLKELGRLRLGATTGGISE
jgi:hypothetical protein